MYEFRLRFHGSLFRINNIPPLVQKMVGGKPLSEPMMFSLHIYIYIHIYASLGLNGLTHGQGTADYFVIPGLWLPLVTRSRLLHPLAAMTIEYGFHQRV